MTPEKRKVAAYARARHCRRRLAASRGIQRDGPPLQDPVRPRPDESPHPLAGDDILVVVLEDTLTPAEHNLVEMGEHQRLRDTRMFFQYATVREFCEPVEQLTGRKVRSFLSAMDTEVDGLCVETFILHPSSYDGPSRTEPAEPRIAAARH
jgi:Na+-translocating membrane potential-generating system (MpsC)